MRLAMFHYGVPEQPKMRTFFVGEQRQTPTVLIASALDDLRAAARGLAESDRALAARPSAASNARWFMRMFVFRARETVSDPTETFWRNLEFARASCTASARSLALLYEQHGDDPVVRQLRDELAAVDQPGIVSALHATAVPADEAQASQQLRPVVARMKVCEARLLSAIQALARRAADA